MSFSVLLTDDAVSDLNEIHEYTMQHDSPRKAESILDKIAHQISGLDKSPDRGSHPGELVALGIKEYRQIYCKPYRIVYRVDAMKVYILLIADGRRDRQSLLERRVLEAE